MMITSRSLTIACAVGVVALLAACAKRPVPLGPLPTPGMNEDSLARARAADSAARADSLRRAARAKFVEDSLQALRDQSERDVAQSANALEILRATIYFEYDQSTLTQAATELLTAKVPVMQARPALRIRITGHTDQRGSAEYNLALGLRRASEVKAYLVANGIDASRIDIFSLGEERPTASENDEEAWAKNRRAEFQPLSGEND
jgi:peptidoglycan-associated lipoprotein